MLQIHQMLRNEEYPNCRKLAERHEISPKTVQRDIDFMRDRLHLPMAYHAQRFGYYYTQPDTTFPGMEVSEGEIVALFVAQKALEQYRGTPFEAPLQTAFSKISDRLHDSFTFSWGELASSISFRGVGSSQADLTLFETLSSAVLGCQELHFDYKKLNSAHYEARQVHPYHLACIEKQWYLFGFDLQREQLRTFALPRMRGARATEVRFPRPADFEISEHLGSSFGVYSSSGHYQIRLRFDSFAAQLIAERHWHTSQQLFPNEIDGSLEMTLELGSLREISRWILGWSGHVKVLAPPELAEQVRAAAQAFVCDHSDPFPADKSVH